MPPYVASSHELAVITISQACSINYTVSLCIPMSNRYPAFLGYCMVPTARVVLVTATSVLYDSCCKHIVSHILMKHKMHKDREMLRLGQF